MYVKIQLSLFTKKRIGSSPVIDAFTLLLAKPPLQGFGSNLYYIRLNKARLNLDGGYAASNQTEITILSCKKI